MKSSGLCASILLAILAATTVQAKTVTYSVSSTCVAGCEQVDLTEGDPVFGTLTFDVSEILELEPFPFNEGRLYFFDSTVDLLSDFSFTFGSLTIDKESSVGYLFRMIWPPEDNNLRTWDLVTGNVYDPARSSYDGQTFFLRGNRNPLVGPSDIYLAAHCNTENCSSTSALGGRDGAINYVGIAPFSVPNVPFEPSPVPLPSSVWLLLAGIGAVFFGKGRSSDAPSLLSALGSVTRRAAQRGADTGY